MSEQVSMNQVDRNVYIVSYKKISLHIIEHGNLLWVNADDVRFSMNVTVTPCKSLYDILQCSVDDDFPAILRIKSKMYVKCIDLINKIHNRPTLNMLVQFLNNEMMRRRKNIGVANDRPSEARHIEQVNAEPPVSNQIISLLQQMCQTQNEMQMEQRGLSQELSKFQRKFQQLRGEMVNVKAKPDDEFYLIVMRINDRPKDFYMIRAQYKSLEYRLRELNNDTLRFPQGLTELLRIQTPCAVRLLTAFANKYSQYIRRYKINFIQLRENVPVGETPWTEYVMVMKLIELYDNDCFNEDTVSSPDCPEWTVKPLSMFETREDRPVRTSVPMRHN